MKREILKIDEDKCNGCGLCIPNCHEGALQIIDGKARLISDLMCDGLGACTGHCPEGALEIEVREAEPYDEVKVMEQMVRHGRNVVIAHMKHLKDHGEFVFLKQAVGYLTDNIDSIDFPVREVIQEVHFYHPGKDEKDKVMPNGRGSAEKPVSGGPESLNAGCGGGTGTGHQHAHAHERAAFPTGSGCPGSMSVSIVAENSSELTQWPVQMHLINPQAAHFRKSDLLLAADCVAYAMGNFHGSYLKGKSLAIACPKLDSNREVYLNKLVSLINDAEINTITVMKMEVPCCSGIQQMAVNAVQSAKRKVPVKSITVGIRGEILSEQWL